VVNLIRGVIRDLLGGRADAMNLRATLVRGAGASFALKVGATALAFVGSVVLARLLGTDGYGAYAYAMAWINVLAAPTMLGMDKLTVREVAIQQAREDWGHMRGLLFWSNIIIFCVSTAVALVVFAISRVKALAAGPVMTETLWIALPWLPLLTLTYLRQSAMQGLHRVVEGQLPEEFLRPALFLVFVLAAVPLLDRLNAPWAVGLNVLAAGITYLIGVLLLRRSLPPPVRAAKRQYSSRVWLRSSLPFLLLGSMQALNGYLPILVLGWTHGGDEVGIFAVAARSAGLIAFFQLAANAVLAPTIARLYAKRETERLQRVITKSSRVMLVVALPLAIGLASLGNYFLRIFGAEFEQGHLALAILCIGQIFYTAVGSVGLLLTMTGHERDAARGVAVSVAANIVLTAVLIPTWGVNGAAIATAATLVTWNLLLALLAIRRAGIVPGIVGRMA
jgi:O-antigen/teichoic acid export membrane protein